MDAVGRALAGVRPFKRTVTVRLERCGDRAEAVWLVAAAEILLCNEALSYSSRFAADAAPALRFILAHEVGHAVADLFEVPVSGSGERDADEFAAILLIGAGARTDVDAAAAMLRRMADQPDLLDATRAERVERAEALACLASGSAAPAEAPCALRWRGALARWAPALRSAPPTSGG